MAKPTTDVAVREEASLPANIDFTADSGAGFEDADSTSYAIPFIRVLQATSPQCKKKDPEYVDGAEEGDFFNTVTNKIYKGDVGITVIPCHYAHKYNEWAPNRGGYRGSHTAAEYLALPKEMRKDDKGNLYEANADTGNSLTDTREHYIILMDDKGECDYGLLTIASTEIKKSKKWMSLMQGIKINGQTAPMFSQMYKLTTVGESNDKGSWAGLKIEHLGFITNEAAYNAAKQFREMVRSGAASATPAGDEVPF